MNFKRYGFLIFEVFILILFTSNLLLAQSWWNGNKESDDDNYVYKVDLDGDGAVEIVRFVPSFKSEWGQFYRIVVKRENSIIWKSPVVKEETDNFAFGEWDDGIQMAEIFGDINNNGKVDMIIEGARSEVAPANHIVYEWNDGRFSKLGEGFLIESPLSVNNYIWKDNSSPEARYIDGFLRYISSGKAIVKIVQNFKPYHEYKAKVKATSKGFKILKWIGDSPLSRNRSKDNRYNTTEFSYIARLSKKDHYNSRGVRLMSAMEILRQDRANFHKGRHIDNEDQNDNYFNTLRKRERFGKMRLVGANRWDLNQIINNTPVVGVRVDGNHIKVEVLRP